jgi:hypothetical protein
MFSATGGDPLMWVTTEPISYTFIKKGVGKDRVEELLRIVFISGRNPTIGPFPDTPAYVRDALAYFNETVKYLEPDPWDGLKLEMPAAFKAFAVPAEDKFTDLLRGRRPMSDVDAIVARGGVEGQRRRGGADTARKGAVRGWSMSTDEMTTTAGSPGTRPAGPDRAPRRKTGARRRVPFRSRLRRDWQLLVMLVPGFLIYSRHD